MSALKKTLFSEVGFIPGLARAGLFVFCGIGETGCFRVRSGKSIFSVFFFCKAFLASVGPEREFSLRR